MTTALRWRDRLPGGVPSTLAAASGLLVVSTAAGLVLAVAAAVRDGAHPAALALTVVFVTALGAVVVGLALLVLRRNRLVWSVLCLLLLATALAGPPDDALGLPNYVIDVAVLLLLVLPPSVRFTWQRPSPYPSATDLRRAD